MTNQRFYFFFDNSGIILTRWQLQSQLSMTYRIAWVNVNYVKESCSKYTSREDTFYLELLWALFGNVTCNPNNPDFDVLYLFWLTFFRTNLHGANIFPDCCTIKVEFAKQEVLNVKTNDDRTRDFTIQVAKGMNGGSQKQKVLFSQQVYCSK